MTASAGTTASFDRRSDTLERFTVWEKIVSFPLVDGDTTGAATFAVNGLLQKIVITLPDLTTDTQLSITIKDNADNTIFSAGPLAENATYNYSVNEPLTGNIDIALSFTDPDSSGTATVTLRGI